MSSLDKTVDLRSYARMAWRHKGIIVLFPVAMFCATLIVLSFVPDEYESSVVLSVEDPGLVSKDVVDLTGGIMQAPAGYRVDEERMAKLAGRVQSRAFLERVIRMLKMEQDPLVRERAQGSLRDHPELTVDDMSIRVLVDQVRPKIAFDTEGPGVYKITVADHSARNARLLAAWIGELYVDDSKQQALEGIQEAENFAQNLLARYDQRLRRSEDALENSQQGAIARNLTRNVVRNENLLAAEALYRRIQDEASEARIRARAYGDSLVKYRLSADQHELMVDPRIEDLVTRLTTALWNEVVDRLAAGAASDARDWPPSGAHRVLRRQRAVG